MFYFTKKVKHGCSKISEIASQQPGYSATRCFAAEDTSLPWLLTLALVVAVQSVTSYSSNC